MLISSFPTRLRNLTYSRQLPLPLRFWDNLCLLDKLEDLDLDFRSSWKFEPVVDWPLARNVLFTGLRTFKVATGLLSPNVINFCDQDWQRAGSGATNFCM